MKNLNKNRMIFASAVFFVLSISSLNNVFAATAPTLGAAANFSVLADLSMAANGAGTTVSGFIGLSTNTATSRTGTWLPLLLTEHFGPLSLAATAQANALTASTNLSTQVSNGLWSLNASPLPGVWTAASDATFTGTLTLNGGPTDVWVFQITDDFTFTGTVNMTGGAQPCNVFWRVARDATINSGGPGSKFVGTLIAGRDISLVGGVTVDGRMLSNRTFTAAGGDSIAGPTCVIPGTLHIIKTVVNTGGGTSTPSNFNLYVKNLGVNASGSPAFGTTTPGTAYSLNAGTYVISEDVNSSYTQSFSGDCNSVGSVTLASGEDKTCTVTNTYIVPTPPVPPTPTGGSGGGVSTPVLPVIGVLKVPTPAYLPMGTGTVVYNYTVWNVSGQQPLSVIMSDDKCSPILFISGDLNSNLKLDPTEIWKYSCTSTLSKTTTNTVTATGLSDDVYHQTTIATAKATVVVGTTTQIVTFVSTTTPRVPTVLGVSTTTVQVVSFPNTGIDPSRNSMSLNIIIVLTLISILTVSTLSLRYLNKR